MNNLAFISHQNRLILLQLQQQRILNLASGGKEVEIPSPSSKHTWHKLTNDDLANVTSTVIHNNLHFVSTQHKAILGSQALVLKALASSESKKRKRTSRADDDDDATDNDQPEGPGPNEALRTLNSDYQGLLRDQFNTFYAETKKLLLVEPGRFSPYVSLHLVKSYLLFLIFSFYLRR